MKKLALLLGLLFASPAFAADNAVIVTPGTGVTMKSKDIGAGVQAMQPILSDTGGNALSTPTAGADGVSNTSTGLLGYSRTLFYNGTTWDRWQGLVTVNTWAGGTLGAMANYGTSPGAVLVPGANAFITNSPNVGISDGASVTLGAKADAACGTSTGTCTQVQLEKYANQQLATLVAGTPALGPAAAASSVPVVLPDPCSANVKTHTPINIASATTTRIIAPTAAKRTYICSIDLVPQAAIKIGIVEGTGGTCGTGTAGVFGGTTAATGLDLNAESVGLAKGNGAATVWATAGTNVDFCLITSTSAQLSGHVASVQAP